MAFSWQSLGRDGFPFGSFLKRISQHLLTTKGRHLPATENAQVKVRWAGDSLGNQLSESLELLHPAFAGLGVNQLRRSFDVANRVQEVELPDGLGRLQRRVAEPIGTWP
jgi:hypothetical protein